MTSLIENSYISPAAAPPEPTPPVIPPATHPATFPATPLATSAATPSTTHPATSPATPPVTTPATPPVATSAVIKPVAPTNSYALIFDLLLDLREALTNIILQMQMQQQQNNNNNDDDDNDNDIVINKSQPLTASQLKDLGGNTINVPVIFNLQRGFSAVELLRYFLLLPYLLSRTLLSVFVAFLFHINQ